MKATGKIILDRKLLTWKWHSQPNMVSVWVHLLMLARFSKGDWEKITLERGQCVVSQEWLAKYVGISKDQLRVCLSRLKRDGSIVGQAHHHSTIITICKYADYQYSIVDKREADVRADVRQIPSKSQQHNNENNEKENKENKEKKEEKENSVADSSLQKDSPETSSSPVKDASETSSSPVKDASETSSSPMKDAPITDERVLFVRRLAEDQAFKQSVWDEHQLEHERLHINYYVVAFNMFLATEKKDKRWSTYENFCQHFRNWVRYQDRQKILRWYKLSDQRRLARLNHQIHQQILAQQDRDWQQRQQTLARQDRDWQQRQQTLAQQAQCAASASLSVTPYVAQRSVGT